MTTHLITAPTTATPAAWQASPPEPAVLAAENVSIYYGSFRAIKEVTLRVPPRRTTALIGPSGSGKSTLLRAFNRMNELIPGTALHGAIYFHGKNLYAPDVDPVVVRRQIGMVFQRPTPFAKSIYANVASIFPAGSDKGALPLDDATPVVTGAAEHVAHLEAGVRESRSRVQVCGRPRLEFPKLPWTVPAIRST